MGNTEEILKNTLKMYDDTIKYMESKSLDTSEVELAKESTKNEYEANREYYEEMGRHRQKCNKAQKHISTALLPLCVEPLKRNRFLFECCGIDPYRVDSVSVSMSSGVNTMKVVFRELGNVSIRGYFKNAYESGDKFTSKLKFLGPTGDIMQTDIFKDCVVRSIYVSTLDYNIDDMVTTTITLEFGEYVPTTTEEDSKRNTQKSNRKNKD